MGVRVCQNAYLLHNDSLCLGHQHLQIQVLSQEIHLQAHVLHEVSTSLGLM